MHTLRLAAFSLGILFLCSLTHVSSTVYGATTFYFDLPSYNAAVATAGLSTNSLNFESIPTGDYSTSSGLTTSGLTFVGPFPPGYSLKVFSESDWGGKFIFPGTGNTLVGVGEIDVTLPPNTRAFGANVGQSAVRVTGFSSTVTFRLPTGANASVTTTPSQLFPFFGFVSDVQVASLKIGFGASFLTIDNVTSGAKVMFVDVIRNSVTVHLSKQTMLADFTPKLQTPRRRSRILDRLTS